MNAGNAYLAPACGESGTRYWLLHTKGLSYHDLWETNTVHVQWKIERQQVMRLC